MKVQKHIPVLSIIMALVLTGCHRKCSTATPDKGQTETVIPKLPRFINSYTAEDTVFTNTDTLLHYQRSACFGFCPTFNYTLYQNGMLHYEGIQHVDDLGSKFGLVTDVWWEEVLQKLKEFQFYELENVYPTDPKLFIVDLPNTIILVKEYGERKKVIDNYQAPKNLKNLEFFLEDHFKKISVSDVWE